MTKVGVKIFLNILTWDLVENTCWTAKRLLLRSSEQDGTNYPVTKELLKDLGLLDVKLMVTILEDEYKKCR